MATRKRQIRSDYYADGSAARELSPNTEYGREYDPAYEPGRTEYAPKRKQQPKAQPKKKKKQDALDLRSAVFIISAIAVTVYVCVGYLKVQADITNTSKAIAAAQSEIAAMKNANDDAREQITASIDLNHIYKVATEELGMVHANKNQVIEYDSTKSNFVRQYGEIPEGKDKSTIGTILGIDD